MKNNTKFIMHALHVVYARFHILVNFNTKQTMPDSYLFRELWMERTNKIPWSYGILEFVLCNVVVFL